MTTSVLKQDPNTKKDSKERLFIVTKTHSLNIFGVIPSSPRKTKQTKKTTFKLTVKRLKTMKKNEMTYLLFGGVVVQYLEESERSLKRGLQKRKY